MLSQLSTLQQVTRQHKLCWLGNKFLNSTVSIVVSCSSLFVTTSALKHFSLSCLIVVKLTHTTGVCFILTYTLFHHAGAIDSVLKASFAYFNFTPFSAIVRFTLDFFFKRIFSTPHFEFFTAPDVLILILVMEVRFSGVAQSHILIINA